MHASDTARIGESFHPSEFIKEELEARGWSIIQLAKRMGGDPATDTLALDMYLTLGPDEPGMRLGNMAPAISKAFGVDADFFTNLEAAWLRATGNGMMIVAP